MPRVLGLEIPDKKSVKISLTYIFGIGRSSAIEIAKKLKVSPDMKASELTDAHIAQIARILEKDYEVEGDLRRQLTLSIRRLESIKCYRGSRHKRGLPVRGQRTKTNARTRKGGKKTVGAIRDKAERKMNK